MYPLDNRRLAAKNSDRKAFFGDEEQVLRQYLKECGYTKSPARLANICRRSGPTLDPQARGAVAGSSSGVSRSLDFDDVPRAEADAVYRRGRNGPIPDADYKKLQDYVFRHIAPRPAAGMAVPLHVPGVWRLFPRRGTNPLLLESVVNDPVSARPISSLHALAVYSAITALLSKPNVYGILGATYTNYPRAGGASRMVGIAPEKFVWTDRLSYSEQIAGKSRLDCKTKRAASAWIGSRKCE